MAHHESRTLQFIGGTVQHGFIRIPLLGAQAKRIEHRRHIGGDVPEARAALRGAVPVGIRPLVIISPDHHIERIGTPVVVDLVLEVVPRTVAGVERRAVLRRDIGVIRHLLVHAARPRTLVVAQHMPAVVGRAHRSLRARRLDRGRDNRIGAVIAVARTADITIMDRRRHPYRTVVLGTVTYRKVPGLMPVDFKIGANMVGIMIIAVFRLYRQLRPARVFRPAIPAAGRGCGERPDGASEGLPADHDAQPEFILRRSAQARERGALGAGFGRDRHALPVVRRRPAEEIRLGHLFAARIIERAGDGRRRGRHLRTIRHPEPRIVRQHRVYSCFDDDRLALHPASAPHVHKGVDQVRRLGIEPRQAAGHHLPVDRHVGRLRETPRIVGADRRIGESRLRRGKHAVAEFRPARHLHGRPRNPGLGCVEPFGLLSCLFVVAGGEKRRHPGTQNY